MTREPHSLSTGEVDGISTSVAADFALDLVPGWNMVSNPFAFSVAWDSCRAVVGQETLAVSAMSGLGKPEAWRTDGYERQDVLHPFQGYWISPPQPLTLLIPPRESGATGPAGGRVTGPQGQGQEGGDVRLAVTGKASGAVSSIPAVVGVSPDASQEWDSQDRRLPPAPPGAAVSVYVCNREWTRFGGNYVTDIRNGVPTPENWGRTWRLDVLKNYATLGAGDRVTLEVHGLEGLAEFLGAVLIDRELGSTVDLREDSSYSFFLARRGPVSGQEQARFELALGTDRYLQERERGGSPPSVTLLHSPYPNPCRGAAVMRYEIPEEGHVELDVYDVRGALVRRIFRGKMPAGRHESMWDGRQEQGLRAPSGLYLLRLRTASGTWTRRLVMIR